MRHQGDGERIVVLQHRVQSRPRVSAPVPAAVVAGRTLAPLHDHPTIFRAIVTLQSKRARGLAVHQRDAEPCRPRGVHAIVHVHPQRRAYDQVEGVSHAHQVPWFTIGQCPAAVIDDPPKVVLRLPPRQSADGVSRGFVVSQPESREADIAQAAGTCIEPPLHYGE